MRRIAATAMAVCAGLATTVMASAPAHAANPPCYVTSDHHLRCGNVAPTELLDRTTYHNAKVTNHLRSNPSWFKCWSRGDYHGGGNNVWYYTLGDDKKLPPDSNGWGWIPAVKVFTSVDPPAGMVHC